MPSRGAALAPSRPLQWTEATPVSSRNRRPPDGPHMLVNTCLVCQLFSNCVRGAGRLVVAVSRPLCKSLPSVCPWAPRQHLRSARQPQTDLGCAAMGTRSTGERKPPHNSRRWEPRPFPVLGKLFYKGCTACKVCLLPETSNPTGQNAVNFVRFVPPWQEGQDGLMAPPFGWHWVAGGCGGFLHPWPAAT